MKMMECNDNLEKFCGFAGGVIIIAKECNKCERNSLFLRIEKMAEYGL